VTTLPYVPAIQLLFNIVPIQGQTLFLPGIEQITQSIEQLASALSMPHCIRSGLLNSGALEIHVKGDNLSLPTQFFTQISQSHTVRIDELNKYITEYFLKYPADIDPCELHRDTHYYVLGVPKKPISQQRVELYILKFIVSQNVDNRVGVNCQLFRLRILSKVADFDVNPNSQWWLDAPSSSRTYIVSAAHAVYPKSIMTENCAHVYDESNANLVGKDTRLITTVIASPRHRDSVFRNQMKVLCIDANRHGIYEGFIDQYGVFHSRQSAAAVVLVNHDRVLRDLQFVLKGTLYSECLY